MNDNKKLKFLRKYTIFLTKVKISHGFRLENKLFKKPVKPQIPQEISENLINKDWSKLTGKTFKISANLTKALSTGIILNKNEQYLIIPNPDDLWNSSPDRWKAVNYKGHIDTWEKAANGMPYMKLCYMLGSEKKLMPLDKFKVKGEGELKLASSDTEGGGHVSNNTGFVRVKVLKLK